MSLKNVDDLIYQDTQEQINSTDHQNTSDQESHLSQEIEASHSQEPMESDSQDQMQTEEPQQEEKKQQEESKNSETSESPMDEYGIPVPKTRLYTEEELQQRIRDRVSRMKYQQPEVPQQQYVNPQPQQQAVSEDDDWVSQLKSVVKQTFHEEQEQIARQQWQQREAQRQADFEMKFSSGMSKYSDFQEVVSDKPITDTMMLATRNLDNPAAFVYGASKLHPAELTRIANIPDPLVQAAEVGRLHERMVKERRMVSQASKPLDQPRGDIGQKNIAKVSLEERIQQHARQKYRR
jgi:hypothetical protein